MEEEHYWKGLVLLLMAYLLLSCATAFPLCIDLEAPVPSNASLSFCSAPEYEAKGCCSVQDDHKIAAQFQAYNISDTTCAAVVKQVLCSQCDAYSADLFGVEVFQTRTVPFLCSSGGSTPYCQQVWNACSNVSIPNSLFQPSLLEGATPAPAPAPTSNGNNSTLDSFWASSADFCSGLGPPAQVGNFCFSGGPFVLPAAESYTPPQGICLEKVVNTSSTQFLNLVPHPDGSNRVFLSTQGGLVYLANLSAPGSNEAFSLNPAAPFLNLSERTTATGELGLMGLAMHPDFVHNGRFFVSYDCDTYAVPDCAAKCACDRSTSLCTTSAIGSSVCRYTAVVAEYTANSSGISPSMAVSANPVEVRRIFSLGLPYSNHHAGGLAFGPIDKYLYYPLGDGGGEGDIWNFAQNLNVLVGKFMRLDVDNIPSSQEISALGLFGNYSVPATNPFVSVKNARPEIWAYGLRNPWRFSFDSQHPTYLYAGDVGESLYEEVDLISKGGNYGWRVYEGFQPFAVVATPGGNTSASSINPIWPIIEYNHSVNPHGYAAVIAGYVSHSSQDPCVYGKYLYGDYFGLMWAAAERPAFSGVYTVTDLPYRCSPSSPLNCTQPATGNPNLGLTVSFGEDNNNDFYVLGGDGIYRLVSPSLCNIKCISFSFTPAPSPSPNKTQLSDAASNYTLFLVTALCLALASYALIWLR
ncbi:unnamed protein product [Sphagnum jensenii]|uniref:Glucose/Sorbosone dehydrogenase domain-containing protein n=1 Tax=Sphagnum jensenii TaxID=128206 RepID=A0ABP1AAN6_9BRYO